MGVIRRKRRADAAPAEVVDAPAEERIVDEGLLIALSAVRMAVKNRIIVGALRDHRNFDRLEYAEIATRELRVLARQNEEYGKRVSKIRSELAKPRLFIELSEDERTDLHQLALRRRVHEGLTIALKAVAADSVQVASLVESAQQDAGAEITGAVAARLVAQVVDRREPNYELQRADRTRTLVDLDLAALLAERRPRA